MFRQVIDYVDVEVTLPPPVKKQVWDSDTQSFVPMTLYKFKGWPGMEQENWLLKSFGHAGTYKNGTYWDYSRAGDFTVMDEKVYIWYQMKWSKK